MNGASGGWLWRARWPLLLLLLLLIADGCAEEPGSETIWHTPRGMESPATPLTPGRPVCASLSQMVTRLPSVRDECRPVSFPSASEQQLFRRALRLLLLGKPRQARPLAWLVGFDLLEAEDVGRRFYVLREFAAAGHRGWGFYAVAPGARRALVLEAPHPQHDRLTGVQAARLMLRLGARALVVATTHRCASKRPTVCDGLSGACRQVWGRGRYRRSDRAHAVNTLFQAAHVELLEQEPALAVVQLHGFARRPGRTRHLILSDGTRLPGRHGSLSNALARATRALLPRRRRRLVVSCNESGRWRALCGTHNVQGRQANGSPDPCRRRPWRSQNRFVQVEQSLDARVPGGSIGPHVLEQALARVFSARGPAGTPEPPARRTMP